MAESNDAFTFAADVNCIEDAVAGKRDAGWRWNPREGWYANWQEMGAMGTISTLTVRSLGQAVDDPDASFFERFYKEKFCISLFRVGM